MKTPGVSPGSSSRSAYLTPWRALALAAAGWLVAALVVGGYGSVRSAWFVLPSWLLAIIDLVVTSLPLVIAVALAVAYASEGNWARATGIRLWRWTDLAMGLAVGLGARALVEAAAPTSGSLGGALGAPVGTLVVLAAGAVLVTPFVEELFFRGLMLRALANAFAGAGRVLAGAVAVLVSTVAFVALHIIPHGPAVPIALLVGTTAVGLGCGILTAVTGRLWAALIAHATFNAIGIVLLAL